MRFADRLWWNLREDIPELYRRELEKSGFEVRPSRREIALRARLRTRIRRARSLRLQKRNESDLNWGLF